MAIPLQIKPVVQNEAMTKPQTVASAKEVSLAIVTYADEYGVQQTQLAVVGDNNVHMLEGRAMGFSKNTTPQGQAKEWLKNGIFKALGRKE